MKLLTSGWALAMVAGASLSLAATGAFAQAPAPATEPDAEAVGDAQMPGEPEAPVDFTVQPEFGEPGLGTPPEFAQVVPPICFDATGEFDVNLNPAVCGVFTGAPGTEGGLGPTGTIPRADTAPGVAMQPAPGMTMEPAPPAAAPDEEAFLPEGEQTPPPPGY